MGERLKPGPEIEIINSEYELGIVQSITELPNAGQNSAYKVVSSDQQYFLRVYRKDINPQVYKNEGPLMHYLNNENLPVPAVISTKSRTFVGGLTVGKPLVVTEYIDGDYYPTDADEMTSDTIIQAAGLLAKYHNGAGAKTDCPWIPGHISDFTSTMFINKDKMLKLWANALAVIGNKKKDDIDTRVLTIASEKIETIEGLNVDLINEEMRHMPAVLAHSDYLPRNLIFKHGTLAALVDWELARIQPRVWEVTRALVGFSKKGRSELFNTPIDWNKAKKFLDTYQAILPLQTKELQRIPDIANIASLYPSYMLRSRYEHVSRRADNYFPNSEESWTFWRDNKETAKKQLNL